VIGRDNPTITLILTPLLLVRHYNVLTEEKVIDILLTNTSSGGLVNIFRKKYIHIYGAIPQFLLTLMSTDLAVQYTLGRPLPGFIKLSPKVEYRRYPETIHRPRLYWYLTLFFIGPQHCGIYAGDEDSYIDFADVFDPLICEYHGLPADFKHTSDMDVSKIKGNIIPEIPVHSVRYLLTAKAGNACLNS